MWVESLTTLQTETHIHSLQKHVAIALQHHTIDYTYRPNWLHIYTQPIKTCYVSILL
jgi:hypothetical protein